jgi:hypothetical protein
VPLQLRKPVQTCCVQRLDELTEAPLDTLRGPNLRIRRSAPRAAREFSRQPLKNSGCSIVLQTNLCTSATLGDIASRDDLSPIVCRTRTAQFR